MEEMDKDKRELKMEVVAATAAAFLTFALLTLSLWVCVGSCEEGNVTVGSCEEEEGRAGDILCTSARLPGFGTREPAGSDPGGGSGGSLGGIGNADGRKLGRVDCCVPAGIASPSDPVK